MSRRGPQTLGLVVDFAGFAGVCLAFARNHWHVGLLTTAATILGAVWALMQGD